MFQEWACFIGWQWEFADRVRVVVLTDEVVDIEEQSLPKGKTTHHSETQNAVGGAGDETQDDLANDDDDDLANDDDEPEKEGDEQTSMEEEDVEEFVINY